MTGPEHHRGDLGLLLDGCTLDDERRDARVGEFEAVLSRAVRRAQRPGPGLLRLELDPDPQVAGQVARLAVAETRCCSFFTFALTAAAGSLTLQVQVPPDRQAALDALTAGSP